MASRDQYYTPGILTASTAVLAYNIASAAIERIGVKYSQEQEFVADRIAVEMMEFIDVDPTALSSVLSKIRRYSILTGNHMALSNEGSHPALGTRIQRIGQPNVFECKDYDIKISFVTTLNAIQLFNKRHFEASKELLQRNIESNVATEDDYVLMAQLFMFLYNNEEKNYEALAFIRTAKQLNVYPTINLHKQEALILLRLNRNDEAKNSLVSYKESLENERVKLKNILNPNHWIVVNGYLSAEYEWSAKMIHKIRKL